MKAALLSASAAFGCIPGLAAIVSGLGAPPNAGLWFGGLGTTAGTFTILAMMANSGRIKQMSLRRINRWSVLLVLTSLLMLLIYMIVYDFCIVSHSAYGTAVFPLWATGELSSLIERAGSRWKALDRYGIYAIDAAVRGSNSIVWVTTIATLLVPYLTFIAFLTAGFSLAAVRRPRAR